MIAGTVEFMPIHFMHKSIPFDEMVALYAVADVCLVSSTRDGMNLVSYEYIASQEKKHGVLILSEFTGAAQSLTRGLIVNPWNTEELSDAIHDAVTMGDEQRKSNYDVLHDYINKYTSAWWGKTFVDTLADVTKNKNKWHGIGSPKPVHYDLGQLTSPSSPSVRSTSTRDHLEPPKSVAFQLDSDPDVSGNESDASNMHEEFLKKQANVMGRKEGLGIKAEDFGDSSRLGTPVQRGEIIDKDGKAIPYMMKGQNGNANGKPVEGNGHAK